MNRPTWATKIRTPEDKIPFLPEKIVIGDFVFNTTATGALETKPISAPPSQEPADLAKPASLVLRANDINLEASAEFGGNILLVDLLNSLLDVPGIISLGGVDMSMRSAFGRLFANFASVTASVADISGVRIPAVLNEVVNNASLDSARELAQALKDATQDASGSLLALSVATASSDIASIAGRVTALEGVPAVDLSGVLLRLDNAESAITNKADQQSVNDALALKADSMALYSVDMRLGTAEGAITSAGGRLDALEASVPTKVAQADYDVAIASIEGSLATLAQSLSTAEADIATAQALAEGAEVKGLMSKLVVEDNSTAGVSGAYWAETQGAVLAGIMDAHKIANYLFDAPASELTIPAGSPVAGAVRRLRNAHASAVLPISLGGVSYEIMAGETAVFQYSGTEWRLL